MRKIRVFGFAFAAVLALAAVSSAAASAHMFTASKTGSLTGKAKGNQVFVTKGGTVTCTALKASGSVTSTLTEEQKSEVNYESCTVFGFVGATISTAHYNFNAGGSVTIESPITISVIGCEVTVPAQGPLTEVGFKNSGEGIEVVGKVTGIESEGKGSSCTYSKEKAGTYTGNAIVEETGGEISWS